MSEIFDSNRITSHYSYDGGITRAIKCPHCKGLAAHQWEYSFRHPKNPEAEFSETVVVIFAKCQACNEHSIWYKEDTSIPFDVDPVELLLYPKTSYFEETANHDMPASVLEVFNEAALVLEDSPRASAALSRLAIDILTKELNAQGKTLNDRIGDLVTKGLPARIQKALDAIRVTGNNAVHPGEIEMSDNKEKAVSLLRFINIIVDSQITQPKAIEEAYNSLPNKALEGIKNRDKSKF